MAENPKSPDLPGSNLRLINLQRLLIERVFATLPNFPFILVSHFLMRSTGISRDESDIDYNQPDFLKFRNRNAVNEAITPKTM